MGGGPVYCWDKYGSDEGAGAGVECFAMEIVGLLMLLLCVSRLEYEKHLHGWNLGDGQ